MHIQNLKQEILTTVWQEVASMIKSNLNPIQQELRMMQQTLTNKLDQQNTVIQQYQDKLTTMQEQFKSQMNTKFIEMQMHHTNLQHQMDAFFARFTQLQSPFQPPLGTTEGGAW